MEEKEQCQNQTPRVYDVQTRGERPPQFHRLNACTRPWWVPTDARSSKKQCLKKPVVTEFPGFHLTQIPKGLL